MSQTIPTSIECMNARFAQAIDQLGLAELL